MAIHLSSEVLSKGSQIGFAITDAVSEYATMHTAAGKPPHSLTEVLTSRAADSLRPYLEFSRRWHSFVSLWNRYRRAIAQELYDGRLEAVPNDKIKERFFLTPAGAKAWHDHEGYEDGEYLDSEGKPAKAPACDKQAIAYWYSRYQKLYGANWSSENMKRYAHLYVHNTLLPRKRSLVVDWFYDDTVSGDDSFASPDLAKAAPAVMYVGDVSIEERLAVLRKVDFNAPSHIDFEGLASQGAFVFENGSFDVLSEGFFEENKDGTMVCHLSEDAFKEAAYFEQKLSLAYGELWLRDYVTKPRLSLEKQLSSLRDRLLLETNDATLANIRAQIKEVERRLYGGI